MAFVGVTMMYTPLCGTVMCAGRVRSVSIGWPAMLKMRIGSREVSPGIALSMFRFLLPDDPDVQWTSLVAFYLNLIGCLLLEGIEFLTQVPLACRSREFV